MGGLAVAVLPVIDLPALLVLVRGRSLVGLGVALLCLAALVGGLFAVVPGLVLWTGTLLVAAWRAARAEAGQT